jgi:hypothetical protein
MMVSMGRSLGRDEAVATLHTLTEKKQVSIDGLQALPAKGGRQLPAGQACGSDDRAEKSAYGRWRSGCSAMTVMHVKVMPAYLCSPIWLYEDPTVPVNIDARELPIPESLVAHIQGWDATFQRTLDEGPGFASELELEAHTEEGVELAAELAFVLDCMVLFEQNAELRPGAERDAEWTLVRPSKSLVFDPEMTRRTG